MLLFGHPFGVSVKATSAMKASIGLRSIQKNPTCIMLDKADVERSAAASGATPWFGSTWL
jgi:hypothetical protein